MPRYQHCPLGVSINLIGISIAPGINNIIINPALITLVVRVIEFQDKKPAIYGFFKDILDNAHLLCLFRQLDVLLPGTDTPVYR